MNYWFWILIAVLGLITFTIYACLIVGSNADDESGYI